MVIIMAGAECQDRSESANEVETESLSSSFVPAPPVSTLLSLFVSLSFPNSDRSNVRVEVLLPGVGRFSMGLQGRMGLRPVPCFWGSM